MLFKKSPFRMLSFAIIVVFVLVIVGPGHSVSALRTESNENTRTSFDPSLTWNTFLGGRDGYDYGTDLTVDGNGNIYVVGHSGAYYIDSDGIYTNPTWGTPKRAYGGGEIDGFIARLNPNGSLAWNTFLGGSDIDRIQSIVIDESGDIYVAGTSNSSWGSPIQPFIGDNDGFVAKLNSSGILLWHTFLDGYNLAGIDLDEDGNIYVIGKTNDNWNTPDLPLHSHSGGEDTFVAKLTSSGDFSWYTFLGGTADDNSSEIAVDNSGKIHIVGTSESTWGNPVRTFDGFFWNAFVAELDSSGTLIWNTFLGAGRDWGNGITVDEGGNVYVAGTSSSTWGSPVREFEHPFAFPLNGFAAKLDTTGFLMWNTFLGNGGEESNGIDIDDNNHIYLVGADYNCTSWGNPFNAPSVCGDGYVAKLDNYGNLITNGFLGGISSDYAAKVYVNGEGNTYVVGTSEGTWGMPIRAFQNSFYDNTLSGDVFVTKLDLFTPMLKVLSSFRSDSNPTSASTISFTVKFSALVTGVDVSDFALTATGVSGASVSRVSGSDNVYTVIVDTGNDEGTIRLDVIDDDSIVDTNSKALGGVGLGNGNFTKGESYIIDRTGPTIFSVTRANSNPAASTSINFLVTFSEPVTGVDASDFSLNTNSVVGATVKTVSGTGATRIVKVSTGSGDGMIRLDAIDNNTILDVASNPLNGGFTTGEVYTIDKPSLPAPGLRLPQNNAIVADTTPTVSWISVKRSVTYEIEVATDNTFTTIVDTDIASGLLHTVAMPLGDDYYFWRVRAYNVSNQPGAWSSTRTFTIDTTGPTAPTLSSPADHIPLNRTPIFKWLSVPGAVLYEFQYTSNSDPGFVDPLYTINVRGTFRKSPAMKIGIYYWHVRAKDANGNWGEWSTPFTIDITSP